MMQPPHAPPGMWRCPSTAGFEVLLHKREAHPVTQVRCIDENQGASLALHVGKGCPMKHLFLQTSRKKFHCTLLKPASKPFLVIIGRLQPLQPQKIIGRSIYQLTVYIDTILIIVKTITFYFSL